MCDDKVDKWQAECITNLMKNENAEIVSTIRPAEYETEGFLKNIKDYYKKAGISSTVNKLTWDLYNKYTNEKKCKKEVEVDSLIRTEKIYCEVEKDGFSEYFKEKDIERLKNKNIDAIVRFAFGIIRGEILSVPKYGVWSFHHDDNQKYRGGPPCFWEIYHKDPVTGAVLQRLTETLDGGEILKRGYFKTKYEYDENVCQVYNGTIEWPSYIINEIAKKGDDKIVTKDEIQGDIYKSPSVFSIIKSEANKIERKIKSKCQGKVWWDIGLHIGRPIDLWQKQTIDVKWFGSSQKEHFLADPFATTINGEPFVFFEKYSYSKRKAEICFIEGHDLDGKQIRNAFETSEHISYPYIFKEEGRTYCIPEMSSTPGLKIYELKAPDNWSPKGEILPTLNIVDPTIISHNNTYWLFCTHSGDYSNTNLYVYYSDNLLSGWKSIYNNPVKTDVRSARPGGTPIIHNRSLYRISQDCSEGYGSALKICKINKLSRCHFDETVYGEITTSEINGKWDGIHHLDSYGDKVFLDAKSHVYNKYYMNKLFKF
ncbi:hypothetical protein GGQ06_003064 [Salinibacter ruber]|nr:hypothetical protein [Salinibacter ruber]